MPAKTTRTDMIAAPKNSPPLTRAALLAPARHGHADVGPDSAKARGNSRSSTKDTAVAANPIRPIQHNSSPCSLIG